MKYKLPVWLSVVIALALVAFGLLYGTWAGYGEERGEVVALLTMENGEKTEYAYDRTDSENRTDNGGSASRQTELVTVSQSGGQSPVPLRTTAPEYRGAVVVCEGGGSAAVRLAVTQVIQSLTGLSADRIVISKMK